MQSSVSFDATAAAVVYTTKNVLNWAKHSLLAGAQAAANIKILERQRVQYNEISDDRIRIIDQTVGRYFDRVQLLLPKLEDAYPDVPQAATYTPVDPCAEQSAQIECNIGSTERAHRWAMTVSRMHAQSDFTRMVVLDPRWYVNIDMYAMTLGNLLRGELPVGDLMEVTTDTAELSLVTGRVGGSHRAGRRNIALARLQAQSMGRAELRRQASLMESVSPVSRMASADQLMQTPAQRVALALTQAQLIQNSLQNVFNRNAQKAPFKLAQVNLKLEQIINQLQTEASQASLVNSFVPNYAAILQPQLNALTSTVPTDIPVPHSPSSASTDPQVNGEHLNSSNNSPVTAFYGGITSGRVASERPNVFV